MDSPSQLSLRCGKLSIVTQSLPTMDRIVSFGKIVDFRCSSWVQYVSLPFWSIWRLSCTGFQLLYLFRFLLSQIRYLYKNQAESGPAIQGGSFVDEESLNAEAKARVTFENFIHEFCRSFFGGGSVLVLNETQSNTTLLFSWLAQSCLLNLDTTHLVTSFRKRSQFVCILYMSLNPTHF